MRHQHIQAVQGLAAAEHPHDSLAAHALVIHRAHLVCLIIDQRMPAAHEKADTRILPDQVQLLSFCCAVKIQHRLAIRMFHAKAEFDKIRSLCLSVMHGEAAGITALNDLQLLTQLRHFPITSSHIFLRIK